MQWGSGHSLRQLCTVFPCRLAIIPTAQLLPYRTTASAHDAVEAFVVARPSACPRQHPLRQHQHILHRLRLSCAVAALTGLAVGVEGDSAHRHPVRDVGEGDVVVQLPMGSEDCRAERGTRRWDMHFGDRAISLRGLGDSSCRSRPLVPLGGGSGLGLTATLATSSLVAFL